MIMPSERELKIIQTCIYESQDNGSKYPGMTYEEGMEAILQLMRGDVSVDEIT